MPLATQPVHGVGDYGKAADGQWYPVGISTPVAATGTLTLAANATEGETFTIGAAGQNGRTVYTWTATLGTTAPNRVLIGGSASDSIDNAISAINRTTGEGVVYSSPTTVNILVSAAAGAGDTMVVTALVTGGEGNNIATTEAMANGSWGAVTLTGGLYGGVKTSPAAGSGGPAGATVTATSVAVPQSTTGTIPAGAKGWTFTILTGTATFNGVASLPAGFSESDVNTLAASITYVTASASTAYVRYNS